MTVTSLEEKATELEKNNGSQTQILQSSQQDEDTVFFRFDPPLYIQRYCYVSKLLSQFNSKTYLDIGCAECKLLRYVKQYNKEVNVMFGIDLDEMLIFDSKYCLQPFTMEYIKKKEDPLEAYLLSGDISCVPDCLLNLLGETSLDLVSLVEVIEHMYPDCLEKTVDVVFGKLKPLVVVMTTPNSEYNVVFDSSDNDGDDDLSKNVSAPKRFRHYDHKFEWTRREFENWCLNILDKYKDIYAKCSFDGVGDAPEKFKNVGKCSQIAVFFHKNITDVNNNLNDNYSNVNPILRDHVKKLQTTQYPHYIKPLIETSCLENTNYKLVDSIQYPYELKLDAERAEKISNELNWLILFVTKPNLKSFNTDIEHEPRLSEEEIQEYKDNDLDIDDGDVKLISIDHLMNYPSIKKYSLTKDDIINIIESEEKYKVTKSGEYIIFKTPENDSYSSLHRYDDEDNENNESKTNITIPDNCSVNLEENWSSEAVDIKLTNRKIIDPDIQFEDADNQSTLNVIYKNDFRLLIDLNALEKPNNYFYNESKLFSQKLRAIRKRNKNELKNFEANATQEQFEDCWE